MVIVNVSLVNEILQCYDIDIKNLVRICGEEWVTS